MPKRIDITGQTFGDLTVTALSDRKSNKGTRLWKCQCQCGKTIYLVGVSLRYGHYKSCGCKRVEKREQGVKDHISRDAIDGTRRTALRTKLHKDNKSGVKGVRWNAQRGKWTAHIGFRGRQISLGYFKNKDDAIQARLSAEDKYHKPYLEDDEK